VKYKFTAAAAAVLFIKMGNVMAKFGVFQTTNAVAALLCAGMYAKVGRKSALAVLIVYYFCKRAVVKKLKEGGIIREKTKGPYKNLVVLDLSMVLAGPLAGQIFSELGAQVINIESLKQPDAGRLFGRGPARGLSGLYANSGRGKQSIVLDLKKSDGLQAFYDLVKKADVVIQNFRPGAVERMRVSYEDCKKWNSNIIYCSSSGFGNSGPYKNVRVYDPIIQTVSGVSYAQGSAGGAPALIGQAFCDKFTAMASAQAIGAALVVRENGGGGQHIQTDMLKVALQTIWPEIYQSHTFLDEQNMMDIESADYKLLYQDYNNESLPSYQFNSVKNAMKDPLFVYDEANHLLFGKSRVGQFPVTFSKTQLKKREAAVLVGEHTRKILKELNYSNNKINEMLSNRSATSTSTLIESMGGKEAEKKAMVFSLLESLQKGETFPEKKRKKDESTHQAANGGTAHSAKSRDGALKSIKVLDITMNIAGPSCTQILSDQEADVIKIEFSDLEDPTRSLGPNGSSDYSAMFATLNRQKKSINIRKNEEVTIMNELFEWCDVVIIDDNIETLKNINYNRVQSHNKKVIYCVIENFNKYNELKLQQLTGSGDCQPEVYNGDSYQTTHSRRSSGIQGLNINVKRKGPPPYYSNRRYGTAIGSKMQPSYACFSIFAKAIGYYSANCITAALYAGKISDKNCGQKLVVDAIKCGCHYVMPDVQWNNVWPNGRFMTKFPELIECYTIVKTKDNKEIFTIAASDKEWASALKGYINTAVENHDEYKKFLSKDELNNPFGRINHMGKLYEIITYAASQTTYEEFQNADGVLCGAVNTRDDMLNDPHINAGNYLTEVNHPQMGRQRQPTVPVQFSQTRSSIRRSASLLDEDRDLVLDMLFKRRKEKQG
jgi:crotonobetainyl-CoA:carnitine CoA-transferase CaiB-like acyl-CoA transferase